MEVRDPVFNAKSQHGRARSLLQPCLYFAADVPIFCKHLACEGVAVSVNPLHHLRANFCAIAQAHTDGARMHPGFVCGEWVEALHMKAVAHERRDGQRR